MIAYVISVIGGDIDKPFIEFQWGSTVTKLRSAPLKRFIQEANKVGIYAALEAASKGERELLAFIYEKYGKHLTE